MHRRLSNSCMSEQKNNLSITESSDFQYLLELMIPLYKQPRFAWLPELFSIIGYEKLILLCKYAGGETIKIPTIEELSQAVEALDWYYKVWIAKTSKITDIPAEYHSIVEDIVKILEQRSEFEGENQ